jgi:hypothetical protein
MLDQLGTFPAEKLAKMLLRELKLGHIEHTAKCTTPAWCITLDWLNGSGNKVGAAS